MTAMAASSASSGGPCHTGNHVTGTDASHHKGCTHNATTAASHVGAQTTASNVTTNAMGSRSATNGTTSKLASGDTHARAENERAVTGDVVANGPRHPRQSSTHQRRSGDHAGSSESWPAQSRPETPATDSSRPTSSAAAGSSTNMVTSENASDSTTSTRRPRARATRTTLAIHAARSVAAANPVMSV